MQIQLLAEQHLMGEDGTEIRLRYELITEELRDSDGHLICELYGARITKEKANQVESHELRNITALGDEILRIVGELSRCCVFPVHMEDCVQELL